ncbi:hypothetical protein [Haloplanus pelagicus]|jgi:hypothetical protein|uniref:hypothetical protein n=1 Tax=Haloplanus pelagicus TaxID=2949995 RepID=UPI0020418A1D|nr:hypothetical protein [Haloplanus sp. HW8-1]
MKVWIDPKETAAGTWGTSEVPSDTSGSPAVPVIERAVGTRYPIQYADGAFLTPKTAEGTDVPGPGGYARLQFNCAVDGAGTIKLTARGYRWGDDESAMRFKSLFSREPTPTETIPFESYERWLRSQHGVVKGFVEGDEYIDFEPAEEEIEEGRDQCAWADLRWAVRLRLAELELVRNPAFARYRLQERDEWEAVRGTLRWKPTAFGDAESET